VQTRRLTTCFEGTNSSLTQSPGKLWSCKDLPNMVNYTFKGKIHPAPKVLIEDTQETCGSWLGLECRSTIEAMQKNK